MIGLQQASIDVMRQEVDEYVGSDGFWCECYAWNSVGGDSKASSPPRSSKSRRALIQAACKAAPVYTDDVV